ncbi:MAG TPA: cytochrome c maturation protein CcmE [Longimicrobiales bacterium]|nr:cytochrome c maturation protein CcmE [Longimicrobiales bacterium]
MNGKKLGLLVGAVLVLAGFGYLVYGGIGNNLVYFLTPSELRAKGTDAVDSPVRLGGMVVPGSVSWNAEAIDLRFRMTDGKGTVEVHARKAPPQMFRDGQGVVVEGKLTRAGIFDASNLMVKHSNEYRPPAPGHVPQEMYKSLVKEAGTT